MDAHAVEDGPGLQAVSDLGDAAGGVQAAGHDLDAFRRGGGTVHGGESVAPSSQHLLGVAKAFGGVPAQGTGEEAVEAVAQRRVEAVEGDGGLVLGGDGVGDAVAEYGGAAGQHLVQRDGGGIPLGVQIPPRRSAVGQEGV